MNRNVLIGIGTGAAICAAGIVYSPPLPLVPEVAAIFAAGLGGIALLVAAYRHHPASVGVGATALLAIGGYALLVAGILTGPAAILAAVLMAGAALLLGRTLLRGGVSGQRLPGGDSA